MKQVFIKREDRISFIYSVLCTTVQDLLLLDRAWGGESEASLPSTDSWPLQNLSNFRLPIPSKKFYFIAIWKYIIPLYAIYYFCSYLSNFTYFGKNNEIFKIFFRFLYNKYDCFKESALKILMIFFTDFRLLFSKNWQAPNSTPQPCF